MKIKFKKLKENAKLPTKGTEHAGAFDVYASDITKEHDSYYIVSLGFATEIPEGYAIRASPRSGLTKTNWYIPNSPCLIDSDYRGDWQVRFRGVPIGVRVKSTDYSNGLLEATNNYESSAHGTSFYELVHDEFPFQIGDRVAQIYLEKVLDMEFEEVENLEETNRGSGGFGSTGK